MLCGATGDTGNFFFFFNLNAEKWHLPAKCDSRLSWKSSTLRTTITDKNKCLKWLEMLSFLTPNLLKSDVCTRIINIIFPASRAQQLLWQALWASQYEVWNERWTSFGWRERKTELNYLPVCLHLCSSPTVFCRRVICESFSSIKKFNVQYTHSVCWFMERSGDRLADWLFEWLMTGWVDLSQYTKHDIRHGEVERERKNEK